MEEVEQINKPEILEKFLNFVNTFGNDFNGKGACQKYADLTGFDKSTISKYMNDKTEIHAVHFFIMRLVNDREEAKSENRKLKKEIKMLKMR